MSEVVLTRHLFLSSPALANRGIAVFVDEAGTEQGVVKDFAASGSFVPTATPLFVSQVLIRWISPAETNKRIKVWREIGYSDEWWGSENQDVCVCSPDASCPFSIT
jgi:hypothetical protein